MPSNHNGKHAESAEKDKLCGDMKDVGKCSSQKPRLDGAKVEASSNPGPKHKQASSKVFQKMHVPFKRFDGFRLPSGNHQHITRYLD